MPHISELPACSTPEGIGGGIRLPHRAPIARNERAVLNARRHRRGNQHPRCATKRWKWTRAQRPKASEGESGHSRRCAALLLSVCSTPEGIGGGISCCAPLAGAGRDLPVLNARRHRRGNQLILIILNCHVLSVLNARRHRRGNQDRDQIERLLLALCSTPEGIGGGIRV